MVAGQQFVLPVTVVRPADVSRVRREAEALDDFLRQASLRHGSNAAELPRLSRSLDDLARENNLNLLHEADRTVLKSQLDTTLKDSPVLHISFSTDPSSAFLAKIVTWLRQNIHPSVLVQVGVQPTIAAGCMIRTSSHVYDLSLRQHLVANKKVLLEKLESGLAHGR